MRYTNIINISVLEFDFFLKIIFIFYRKSIRPVYSHQNRTSCDVVAIIVVLTVIIEIPMMMMVDNYGLIKRASSKSKNVAENNSSVAF